MSDPGKIPLQSKGFADKRNAVMDKKKQQKARKAADGATSKHNGNGAATEEPPPIWGGDEYGPGYGSGPKPNRSTREFKPVRFKDVKFIATSQDVIKGLFPKDGLIIVWGPPKCGKSFWVYDAAMYVARGEFYRERRVTQGLVVYVACEGERGLKARTEAYRRTLPEGADPPFYLLTTQLDLIADVENLIRDIRAAVGNDVPILIVIDTLNRSLNGNENDPTDMTAYVQASDKIRQAFNGSSVVLIHHCGIEGTRPRGFTGLSAAADAQIKTTRDAAKNIVAAVEFMKDGDEGDSIVSKLRVIEIAHDEYGDAITSCVVEPVDPTDTPPKVQKLTPSQQSVLDQLDRAIATAGQKLPSCNHIPAGMIGVTEELWRAYYYATQISDKQDTKQRSFKRGADALLARGLVGKWNEYVWIVR
jgi:hypothetical protein